MIAVPRKCQRPCKEGELHRVALHRHSLHLKRHLRRRRPYHLWYRFFNQSLRVARWINRQGMRPRLLHLYFVALRQTAGDENCKIARDAYNPMTQSKEGESYTTDPNELICCRTRYDLVTRSSEALALALEKQKFHGEVPCIWPPGGRKTTNLGTGRSRSACPAGTSHVGRPKQQDGLGRHGGFSWVFWSLYIVGGMTKNPKTDSANLFCEAEKVENYHWCFSCLFLVSMSEKLGR